MAEAEARRRMRDGKRDVVLWTIRVDDSLEWEEVKVLQEELGFWIRGHVYHNAMSEVLFVHCIPRHYVVCGKRFTDEEGRPTTGTFWIQHSW
ncbi:hypothetical protein DTO271G3_1365 [Paecilomyces variotii]|nr:hypothetical protein DTO271G3_1365 [Paecilomyces variotii]